MSETWWKMWIGLHVQYRLLVSRCNEPEMSRQILDKYQISWKSVQWEPNCSMRADMTKLLIAFRSFANSPIHSVVTEITICTFAISVALLSDSLPSCYLSLHTWTEHEDLTDSAHIASFRSLSLSITLRILSKSIIKRTNTHTQY
jgi:hypothetical protein